jgi:hypothetical protein
VLAQVGHDWLTPALGRIVWQQIPATNTSNKHRLRSNKNERTGQVTPELAEGLRGLRVPRWIRDLLRGYSAPGERLAFPNFRVELKRDQSMFPAHVQNRHCGASASQAFVEYFVQALENPESAWNIARVGPRECPLGEYVVLTPLGGMKRSASTT